MRWGMLLRSRRRSRTHLGRRIEQARPGRPGGAVVELEPRRGSASAFFGGHAFDLHPVGFSISKRGSAMRA